MQPVIVTPETPLLIAGEQDNRRVAALSFDLHDSDLPLQPSFPVLIFNLVNWFLPPPVAGSGQVAPDTPVSIAAWPGVNRITITGPGQQPVTVAPPFPVTAFNQTDTPGIYDVTQYSAGTGGQVRHGAFVVNLFDPLQSRLAPIDLLPIAHSVAFTTNGPGIPRVLREVWPWIAALLLLVLCAEWWLFSRSYTLSRKNALASRRGGGGADEGWGRLRRPRPARGQSLPNGTRATHSTRATQASPPFPTLPPPLQAAFKRITKARKRQGRGVQPGHKRSKGKRNADV